MIMWRRKGWLEGTDDDGDDDYYHHHDHRHHHYYHVMILVIIMLTIRQNDCIGQKGILVEIRCY
jgi:hypothetical protein